MQQVLLARSLSRDCVFKMERISRSEPALHLDEIIGESVLWASASCEFTKKERLSTLSTLTGPVQTSQLDEKDQEFALCASSESVNIQSALTAPVEQLVPSTNEKVQDLVQVEPGPTKVHVVATVWGTADMENPIRSLYFGLERDCNKTIVELLEEPPNCVICSTYEDNLALCHKQSQSNKSKKSLWKKVKNAFKRMFCLI